MTTEEKMLEVIKKIAKAKEVYKKAINQIAAYEYEQEISKLTDELVGLYDALECRPAVQVTKTKTISQMASASAQRNTQKIRKSLMEGGLAIEESKLQTRHAYRTYKYGFINGMKAMKKIDIDRAVEWLRQCTTFQHPDYRHPVPFFDEEDIELFKHAMKEGL